MGTIPIVGLTFYGASPTQTAGAGQGEITTYDIARQYDGFSDFPTNPLFVLSDINAFMGIVLVHPDVSTVSMQNAVLQDEYGDTSYYIIPTYPVPLLMPLAQIPTVGPILADMLDPAVRQLVEAGYDRTISPGQPTPANFLYFPNPIALDENLLLTIPTGLDNGVQGIIGVRPFGTERPDVTGQGAYGINGPPVTTNPTTNQQQIATTVSGPAPPNTDNPNEQQTATTVSGAAPSNTDNPMAASTPTPLAVKRVPARNEAAHRALSNFPPPPTDNQPLSDENVHASNPPTTPTETETTQGTTFTKATANPVPPKIRRPFRSDPLLKEKELRRSPDSVFNKASTVTTTATTGAGRPTEGMAARRMVAHMVPQTGGSRSASR